jgi:GDPmannose 4,6-dehydratase
MESKRALITGVDGQDGLYLSNLLLEKGYTVYGLVKKKSIYNLSQTRQVHGDVKKIYGDITDFTSVIECIREAMPDQIYNLAGQSSVPLSWKQPATTARINGVGVVNLLEGVRMIKPDTRFFQASSSEMFETSDSFALDETSRFMPRNPYGCAKLFGHWATINFRESYKIYSCSGILFNHESEHRGLDFVTRKITSSVAKVYLGVLDCIELGNIDAVRDWGHAADYVKAMWLMLSKEIPKDYVIATGEPRTVRDFVQTAFQTLGFALEWYGEDLDEIGVDRKTGKIKVRINLSLYRYPKNDIIIGNPKKIETELGFKREIDFETMVSRMVENDVSLLRGQ